MRIAVIGASGGLGLCLVNQALANGLNVTAVVRKPQTFSITHHNLTVKRADITDQHSLEQVLPNHDAVLVAVAPRLRLRETKTLLSIGAAKLTAAMTTLGIKRLVWVTSAGLDPQYVKAKPFFYRKIIKPIFLNEIYSDFKRSEDIVQSSQLEWIVIRPSRLTNGEYTGEYRVQTNGTLKNANHISRADVADLMLKQIQQDFQACTTLMVAY